MTHVSDKTYPQGSEPPANEVQARAEEVRDATRTEVANVADEARQEARNVLGDVRGQLDGQANDVTHRIAESLASAADELRSMADASDRPDAPIATAVRQVADKGTDLARSLEDRGYRGVANDVSRFGRDHAGAFLLAAGAAGFVVGRMLRNTDTSAVAHAAGGDRDREDTRPQPAIPDPAERPTGEVLLSHTYDPVRPGAGGR